MLSFASRRVNRILHPPFFGLDISDLSIKFLKIGKEGAAREKKIEYFGEIPVPEGIVEIGEIEKEKELSDILKNELKDSQGKMVTDKFVVASLPEEKSFVRIIQLPKIKHTEVGAAIRWEIEANIPLPIDQVYFDYEVIGSPETPKDHIDALITAFPRAIVDSYVSAIRSAGFLFLAIELESQAISRAVIEQGLLSEALIIVDIGMTRTSFIIFGAGSIILTISTNLGGLNFNRAIAEKLGVPLEEGERMKKEFGFDKSYKGGILTGALQPYLTTLVDEIKKQIWFYRDHAQHQHGAPKDISKILLVGGDANLIGLEKFLSVALKKNVVAANPFVNIYTGGNAGIPPIPKNISLKYTTTIGLALRE